MFLTRLALTNYRNFTRMELDVPRGAIILVGDNAQGKTSLLEAVYFLATFTSFHASSDRQLINFVAGREPLAVGRIVADYKRGGRSHQMEVRIIQESNGVNGSVRVRKEILLDGSKRKAHEAIGHFNAVLFLPQMLGIIEGTPIDRRRYLNLALSQVVPNYAASLSTYNRAITQRNALLKQLSERGGEKDQLDYWDERIALAGAHLIQTRIQAVQEIERIAALIHKDLTRGTEILRLDYKPAFDPLPQNAAQLTLPLDAPTDRSKFSQEEIAMAFQQALTGLRRQEIARGQTIIGPHRDELRFLANTIDLGIYGSRGQVRTALLALKIAEVAWMKEKTGHWPVLLLDEVLAELDPQRREDLLTRLADSEQALLTTTDLDLFTPEFVEKVVRWQVHEGRVGTVFGA
jgi:DNA replication and repair protein RecF